MFYSLREKYTDNLLVLLLVFTGGGLLFVFNRNLMYYIFTALLIIVILLNFFKLKRELTNSIIFTTISILSLFIVNFFFAVSEHINLFKISNCGFLRIVLSPATMKKSREWLIYVFVH